MTLDDAVEVFVRGFAAARSFTHPYVPERVEGIWVLRDAPRRTGPYRSEEYVAYGIPPSEADRIARQHTRGNYRMCMLRAAGEPDSVIRTGFRDLGYRLNNTEQFFIHDLQSIEPASEPLPIVRLASAEQAQALGRACRWSSKTAAVMLGHITSDPPGIRQYMAMDGEAPIGWAASIVAGDSTWCHSVFVQPQYRRRGIARAMLNRMLTDDRDSGARASVLLASHTGALLYPRVGYESIGELFVYTPLRR